MKSAVEINEVAPRDGLQMERKVVDTDKKVAFIDALSACGFARIEVTSYTSPKAIPTLADAEAVMTRIRRFPGVKYTALVPNMRGLERALAGHPDEINLVMSASETHNRANLRMTRMQSLAVLMEVLRHAASSKLPCAVSLSTAFGCPFDGEINEDEVVSLASKLHQAGASSLTVCDTTGMAHPDQVTRLCERLQRDLPSVPLTIHLHNTRGMGLVNALAGYRAGIRSFDGSAAGLGGCPYAPGASGNVNSEELVHMFEAMGINTGVDLNQLLQLTGTISNVVDRPVSSQLASAGPIARRYPPPAWLSDLFPA